MSESNHDLIRRVARLLKEELQARDIGFVLVTVEPLGEDHSHLGVTSNLEITDAADAMLRVVLSLANKQRDIKLLDADERQEGHA
jgi:hypothetical protein